MEIEKRNVERKAEHAVDNWRKVMKHLLLKKKLELKYGLNESGSGKLLDFIKKKKIDVEIVDND